MWFDYYRQFDYFGKSVFDRFEKFAKKSGKMCPVFYAILGRKFFIKGWKLNLFFVVNKKRI